MGYTITIVDFDPVLSPIDGTVTGQHCQFEITDSVDTYTYSTDFGPTKTKTQAQTTLDNNAAAVWAEAEANGDEANVLRKSRLRLLVEALGLSILDLINALETELSLTNTTIADLKAAVKAKMDELTD